LEQFKQQRRKGRCCACVPYYYTYGGNDLALARWVKKRQKNDTNASSRSKTMTDERVVIALDNFFIWD
jgi:hypothetical protein